MTCFLTPDGEPFYCGTYYPPTPRAGMPSFRQLLDAVAQAWRDDGARVRGAAGQIAARLADNAAAALPPAALDADALDRAAAQALAATFDARCTAGSAARRSSRRRWCWSSCCATTSAPARRRRCTLVEVDRGADGPRRACTTSSPAASPATAWTRAGWCRTSRRCSTTTPCCCGSTRTWPGSPGPQLPSPGGRRGDRGLPAARPAHGRGRLRLGAGRGHRRRRGPDLRLDARRSCVEVLGDDDGAWAAALLARDRGRARSSTARSTLQLPADPDDPARWARVRGALLARATGRPQPAATTRWSRRGTGWRSPRWPRRAPRSAGRTGWRPPARRRRPAAARGTWSTAGCGARRATARSAPRPACWRTTACLADGAARAAPGHRRGAAGSAAAVELLDLALAHFAEAGRRASSTPPTTPRRCCTGPASSPTTRRPSGRSALAAALLTASRAGRGAGRGTATRPRRRCARPARWPRGTRGSPAHWLTVAEARRTGPLQVAVVGGDDRPGALAGRAPARTPPAAPWSSPAQPDAAGRAAAGRPAAGRRRRGGLRLPRVRLRPPRHDRRGARRSPRS